MAEHKLEPVGHLDVHQFLDLLPERRLLQTIGVVVVAGDEELLPIEATEIGIVVGECEVADVEELIAWPDARVVALDHDLVHLLDG